MQKIRNTKKLKKNIKKSFRKTKINKINKMKGGLPKKLKQPLDDIYYEDRIPMYLPNFPEIYESYDILDKLKKKFGIETYCEKENNFFKKYTFKDEFKFKRITHKFKLFSRNTVASSLCINDADPRDRTTNHRMVNGFMVLNFKEKVEKIDLKDMNDYVWCKALFPDNWTCTSSPVTSVLMYQGYNQNPTIVEKPLNIDDYGKIVANEITYFFKSEPKFIINCVRYLEKDFINIDVQEYSTEKTEKFYVAYNANFPCEPIKRDFGHYN